MTKIAIFVEGITERKFIKKLIYRRYASVSSVLVKEMVLRGKGSYFQPIDVNQAQGIDCLFLIIEAPEYSKMISMVADNAETMIQNIGYAFVIGLRDLIPNRRNEKTIIINGIDRVLSRLTVRNRIGIILAVMETEAWFLYDWQLFQRIDNRLSTNHIKNSLGIDLVIDDPEEYEKPVKILDKILRLADLRYRKHENEVDTIVSNINFNHLFSCDEKIDSFIRFRSKLDYCGLPHQ